MAVALSVGATSQAVSQETVTVAIDVDVTGNNARTVGTVDNCVRIDSTGTNQLKIDAVVLDPGVSPDVGIKAWQFYLLYDESVVRVVGHNPQMLLAQAEHSDLLTALSDEAPDSDGSFTSAAVEFGTPIGIEPSGVNEVGPGVIARITLEGVAKGTTELTLSDIILVGANDAAIPLGNVLGATVSVDTPCVPPPSPTPGTGGGSPTAPGTGTPLPGTPGAGTPQPGTPGADTGANGPPESGVGAQTPGEGTPNPSGTAAPGDQEAAGGEATGSEDNGGLSAAAWAGIAAGIATAAVAASGAGWFALRRRRAGGPPTSGGKAGSE